ncbi:hypothetical protein VDGL01_01520 [Verticillium dahliae]
MFGAHLSTDELAFNHQTPRVNHVAVTTRLRPHAFGHAADDACISGGLENMQLASHQTKPYNWHQDAASEARHRRNVLMPS